MDFIERLQTLSKKIAINKNAITTEEATKNAFVMPFIHQVLGYDVFNPLEVIPEFTADACTKKGEKVDYALLHNGVMQVLVECKKYGEPLSLKHANQLFRYFSVTNVRIAILTNGSQYQFFTDLDVANKMDEKPFLVLDLENIDEHVVPEVKKLTKHSFDLDSIIGAAGDLKYLSSIKKIISEQFKEPEEDFVVFFARKVYDKLLTPKMKQSFAGITEKALKQFLSDRVNDRLKNAIESEEQKDVVSTENEVEQTCDANGVVTTGEELEGFQIVKAILRKQFSIERIVSRDTKSYFGILLDDNNRKPLCRLYFNTKQKYLVIIDKDKNEIKQPINNIDEIYNFTEELLSTTAQYLEEDIR